MQMSTRLRASSHLPNQGRMHPLKVHHVKDGGHITHSCHDERYSALMNRRNRHSHNSWQRSGKRPPSCLQIKVGAPQLGLRQPETPQPAGCIARQAARRPLSGSGSTGPAAPPRSGDLDSHSGGRARTPQPVRSPQARQRGPTVPGGVSPPPGAADRAGARSP